jgi:hypothetical protein
MENSLTVICQLQIWIRYKTTQMRILITPISRA